MVQDNQKYEELDLFQSIAGSIFGFRHAIFQTLSSTLLCLSLWVTESSSLDVFQQGVCIYFFADLFSWSYWYLIGYKKWSGPKILKHPITIGFYIGFLLNIFSIPYYSLFLLILSCLPLYQTIKDIRRINENQIEIGQLARQFQIEGQWSFYLLYCIFEEGFINFNISQYLIILKMFLFFSFDLYLLKMLLSLLQKKQIMVWISQRIKWIQWEQWYYMLNYFLHRLTLILILENSINSSPLFQLYFPYLAALLLLCYLLEYIFTQEILIYAQFSAILSSDRLVYKTHYRQYLYEYKAQQCRRNVNQPTQKCLLCQKQAVMIYFPCGHLNTCVQCEQKLQEKEYELCLICSQNMASTEVLSFDDQKVYGVQAKWFIRLQPPKNVYLLN